jgi:hypothetical protein
MASFEGTRRVASLLEMLARRKVKCGTWDNTIAPRFAPCPVMRPSGTRHGVHKSGFAILGLSAHVGSSPAFSRAARSAWFLWQSLRGLRRLRRRNPAGYQRARERQASSGVSRLDDFCRRRLVRRGRQAGDFLRRASMWSPSLPVLRTSGGTFSIIERGYALSG